MKFWRKLQLALFAPPFEEYRWYWDFGVGQVAANLFGTPAPVPITPQTCPSCMAGNYRNGLCWVHIRECQVIG